MNVIFFLLCWIVVVIGFLFCVLLRQTFMQNISSDNPHRSQKSGCMTSAVPEWNWAKRSSASESPVVCSGSPLRWASVFDGTSTHIAFTVSA
jgi:hypothetical protein